MAEDEQRFRDDPSIDASFREDLAEASRAGFDEAARRRIAARLAPLFTPGEGGGGNDGGATASAPRETSAAVAARGANARLVVGALTGAVVATVITVLLTRDGRDDAGEAPPPAAPAVVTEPPAPAATDPSHLDPPPSADVHAPSDGVEGEPTRRHGRRASTATIPEPTGEALPTEMSLLDAAHGALNSAPNRALDYLARHRELYPRGVFAEERDALTIEALVNAGRAAEAVRRADEFLRAHPRSAHRARLEQVLGRGPVAR